MKTRAAAIVVGVTTAVALGVLGVRGLFVRWFGDDYWISAAVATRGFWGGQAYWYRVWSGRYVFNFVVAALESIGPRATALLVIVTILGMVAALRERLRWPLAMAMTWAILFGTVDLTQSVLWQTGLFSYTVPLALFAWWLGNAAGRAEWRWYGIVPLVSGGCSEVLVLTQVVVCAIAFAAWRRRPLLAGLLGSLASLGIVAAAPGNAVRSGMHPATPPFFRVIEATLADAGAFLAATVAGSGMALLLVFLMSALIAPRISRRTLIVAVLCAAACTLVTFGAAEVTLVTALPQRAWIIPYAFFIAAVAALGAAIPWPERWRTPLAAPLMIIAIVPVITAVQWARDIPDARAFAMQWDRFDAFLRANRGRAIYVDHVPGTVGTLLFLAHDPEHGVNRTMSETYGLRSLVRMPPYHHDRLATDPLPNDAVRYRFDDAGRAGNQ